MKKIYQKPAVGPANTVLESLLADSGVWSNGIDYGGVDNDGTHTPASRRQNSLWNDDGDEWLMV